MKTLCLSVVTTATTRCPTLVHQAKFIQKEFEKIFRLFANCRAIYDTSKSLDDGDIDKLGKVERLQGIILVLHCVLSFFTENHIDKFMEEYREAFPHATIIPKLHMLEDHIVPFLKKWRIGMGLLGEQGAESIHARFNSIKRNYSNMPNPVERLECVMAEHLRQVCPDNIVRMPPPKKRAKKS